MGRSAAFGRCSRPACLDLHRDGGGGFGRAQERRGVLPRLQLCPLGRGGGLAHAGAQRKMCPGWGGALAALGGGGGGRQRGVSAHSRRAVSRLQRPAWRSGQPPRPVGAQGASRGRPAPKPSQADGGRHLRHCGDVRACVPGSATPRHLASPKLVSGTQWRGVAAGLERVQWYSSGMVKPVGIASAQNGALRSPSCSCWACCQAGGAVPPPGARHTPDLDPLLPTLPGIHNAGGPVRAVPSPCCPLPSAGRRAGRPADGGPATGPAGAACSGGAGEAGLAASSRARAWAGALGLGAAELGPCVVVGWRGDRRARHL